MKKWQDTSDKKHELAIMKLQIEQAEKGIVAKLEEVGIQEYSAMVQSAQRSQDSILGNASRWVVDLTASVRPVVTYLFMISFIGFKMASFCAAINPSLPWQDSITYSQAMLAVWGAEETAIFAGIIAFWFGDRAMTKKK